MTDQPTSFEEVDLDLLIKQATEDWAVDAKPSDSRKVVIKKLGESGVDWNTYSEHYGFGAEPVPEAEEEVAVAAPKRVKVVGAEPLEPDEEIKYLVKMDRENVSYQVGNYTFTDKHPYALVDGADLDYVLTHEPGFRQARPSEVQEFYS